MAYSNWGGFVYCDDHALHDHCDATPRQVFGLQSEYASYMQHFVETAGEDKPNPFTDMYHAVVGDEEAGVLVCLHKSYIGAVIAFDGNGHPTLPDHPFGWTKDWEAESGTFRAGDIAIEYSSGSDPECIEVSFTDALGRQWRGRAGYCMGEGFEDWG